MRKIEKKKAALLLAAIVAASSILGGCAELSETGGRAGSREKTRETARPQETQEPAEEPKTLTQEDANKYVKCWASEFVRRDIKMHFDFLVSNAMARDSWETVSFGKVTDRITTRIAPDYSLYSWSGLNQLYSLVNQYVNSSAPLQYKEFKVQSYSFDTIEYTSKDSVEFWVKGEILLERYVQQLGKVYEGTFTTHTLYFGFRNGGEGWEIFDISVNEPAGVEWVDIRK